MTLDRVQGMFLMTAGCSFFAWITGKITELLTQKSSSQTRFAEEVEELDTFATSRNMPRDLRRHLFQFYKMKYPNERIVDMAVIVSNPQQDCYFQIRKLVLFLATVYKCLNCCLSRISTGNGEQYRITFSKNGYSASSFQ
jgi:hypothetical protein